MTTRSNAFLIVLTCLLIQPLAKSSAFAQASKKKILVVVTSNAKLLNGQSAGYYLPELVDFVEVIRDQGLDTANFDVVSPKGGKAPMYRRQTYLNYYSGYGHLPSILAKVDQSRKPSEIDASAYAAVYYVGGFASLIDLPKDTAIGKIAMEIYRNGGVLGAVCHGPSGLLAIRQEDGTRLISGKRLTTRSWDEESGHDQITREDVLAAFPFILFEEMEQAGAEVSFGPYMEPYVVTDGRIVTGQNEYSATGVAQAMISLLSEVASVETTSAGSEINVERTAHGLEFSLGLSQDLTVELTDMLGRVRTARGATVRFDNLNTGHYLARFQVGTESSVMKIAY
ncbi:MAG TPA: DJ-1/PfpI family protein [Candidatus Kapabacteria bacterium]|nr:DJ-1/PfpI family protein [Candidatus Kapabacteria bacterium]